MYILYPEAVELAGVCEVHELVPNWPALERVLAVRTLYPNYEMLILLKAWIGGLLPGAHRHASSQFAPRTLDPNVVQSA